MDKCRGGGEEGRVKLHPVTRNGGRPGVASRLFCNQPQGHAHSPSFPRYRLGRPARPREIPAPLLARKRQETDLLAHTPLGVQGHASLSYSAPSSIPPPSFYPTAPSIPLHTHTTTTITFSLSPLELSERRPAVCTGSLISRAQRAPSPMHPSSKDKRRREYSLRSPAAGRRDLGEAVWGINTLVLVPGDPRLGKRGTWAVWPRKQVQVSVLEPRLRVPLEQRGPKRIHP